jgi:glyoxylase-like metal-dependent hydrolase (beta-lactamase superfamily II)
MKIIRLYGKNSVYSSNVYLVRGSWNRIEDVNTLIDVGSDPTIVDAIMAASTGLGKNKIDQVILTHSHSDHTAALPPIRELFRPKVYAFSEFTDGAHESLKNGAAIRIGDRMFEVIHIPGHSSDSICLYNEDEEVLFVGDVPVLIRSPGGTYEEGFVRGMEALCRRRVRAIYFGHGDPTLHAAQTTLLTTLEFVRTSIRFSSNGNIEQ